MHIFAIITRNNTLPDMKECSHRCNPILFGVCVCVYFGAATATAAAHICVFSSIHTLINFLRYGFIYFFNMFSYFNTKNALRLKLQSTEAM